MDRNLNNSKASFLNMYSAAPSYIIEFDNFTELALQRFSGKLNLEYVFRIQFLSIDKFNL